LLSKIERSTPKKARSAKKQASDAKATAVKPFVAIN
jgi:hypothetical protein